jgi:hypothetical protein
LKEEREAVQAEQSTYKSYMEQEMAKMNKQLSLLEPFSLSVFDDSGL